GESQAAGQARSHSIQTLRSSGHSRGDRTCHAIAVTAGTAHSSDRTRTRRSSARRARGRNPEKGLRSLILLDTSGVLAALLPYHRRHLECANALRDAAPPRILSPFVLAELDCLLHEEAGGRAELLFLDDVGRGAYQLESFDHHDVAEAAAIIKTYHDLKIGLTDASIAVLARRHRCHDVLTLDERHFRPLRAGGKNFRILPADA